MAESSKHSPRGERGTDTWRPVENFGGIFREFYEVSDLGRIWGVPRERTPGGILKPLLRGPYYGVTLCAAPHPQVWCRVHVLVASAFLDPCPPGMEVRHGPAGSLVNSVDNLSYGTQSENMMDRVRDGTSNRGERCGSAKLTREIVLICRARYAQGGETYESLAREFSVAISTMSDAIVGRTWFWL